MISTCCHTMEKIATIMTNPILGHGLLPYVIWEEKIPSDDIAIIEIDQIYVACVVLTILETHAKTIKELFGKSTNMLLVCLMAVVKIRKWLNIMK